MVVVVVAAGDGNLAGDLASTRTAYALADSSDRRAALLLR
jgi:hypothetical protein